MCHPEDKILFGKGICYFGGNRGRGQAAMLMMEMQWGKVFFEDMLADLFERGSQDAYLLTGWGAGDSSQ